MVFFVVGPPGRLAEWCDQIALVLARTVATTELIRANSLTELAVGAITTGGTRLVVAARQPGADLRAALAASGQNFILALDDPRHVLAELVLLNDMPLAAAVATLASSCGAMRGCTAMPGALRLRREGAWREPIATVEAIARHLRLSARVTESIAPGRLTGDAVSLSLHQALAWWDDLDTPSREIAEGALGPYLRHLRAHELGGFNWSPDLFFLGDQPNERATHAIDITGRARCLLHGPYVVLPLGGWSMSVDLVFSREATEHDFLVEVLTDRQLASATIRPQDEGRCEAGLSFVIDESSDRPVVIRISTQRAAFDGLIILRGVQLLRHTEAA